MKVTAGSLGFSRGLKTSVGAAEVGRCWVLCRQEGPVVVAVRPPRHGWGIASRLELGQI